MLFWPCRLSKLIGLEILKLHEENEGHYLLNIAEYEKVLRTVKELYKVIKGRLRDSTKKCLPEIRRAGQALRMTVAKAYVEKVVIEDLYVCFDRFGYTKAVDAGCFWTGKQKRRRKSISACAEDQEHGQTLRFYQTKARMHQVKMEQDATLQDEG